MATGMPLRIQLKDGVVPPFTGVAVKVTKVLRQTVSLGNTDTITSGDSPGNTTLVFSAMAVSKARHDAVLIIFTDTTSPSIGL